MNTTTHTSVIIRSRVVISLPCGQLRAVSRGMVLRILIFILVLLAAPLRADQSTLRINIGAEPSSLNPHKISGTWEDYVVGDLFEGLITEDAFGNPIPGQASSWSISEDGKVYTFQLRDNLVWSDGHRLTANDFVFAFRRLFDPTLAAEYAYLQFPIKNASAILSGELNSNESLGVKALSDTALEISLEHPTPYFINLLTHFTAYPLPSHVIEQVGDGWSRVDTIVTNGAYRPTEWLPGSHLSAEKNHRFHAANEVAVETIDYYFMEDLSAALLRYRTGEFDILTDFPSDRRDWIEKNVEGRVLVTPFAGVVYLVLNHERPPFDDERVRRALSLAIERELFGTTIIGTGEPPAFSFVPPGIANYSMANRDEALHGSREERLAESSRLLQAAGFGAERPLEFSLDYPSGDNYRRLVIAIASMWKPLGVEVSLINTELKVLFSKLTEQDFTVGGVGWIADYNDAENFLSLFHSSVEYNYGKYKNIKVDELLDDAESISDPDERAATLHEVESHILSQTAAIPLYYMVARNIISPRISGYHPNVFDKHRSRWVSFK